MSPNLDFLGFVTTRRDQKLDAELRRIAPHLADVPERVARFLGNVQRMLTSSGLEAGRYAAEVAREAEEVALLRAEWADMRTRIAETMAAEAIRVPRHDDARLAAAHARIAAMPKEKHHEAMARASRSYSAPRMCVEHDGCRIDAARMEMVWPDGERWPMRSDVKEAKHDD